MVFVVTGTQCLIFISLFLNYPIEIKIWECSIPCYLNTHLFPDFLYLLHLKPRLLWTFPSWSLLETSFSRLYTALYDTVVFPIIWLYQCLI